MLPTDILIKASKYYNVSVDYILGLTEERHNDVCQERLQQHLLQYENMMLEYAALKPEYRAVVSNVVRTLTEIQDTENS